MNSKDIVAGHCPVCHGDNVTGDSIEIDGIHAYQEVSCLDCDTSWLDEYVLAGQITVIHNHTWVRHAESSIPRTWRVCTACGKEEDL